MPRRPLTLCLCALVALLVPACVPSEAEEEEVADYGGDTTMGRLQREGTITIALPDDLGPFSSVGDDGEPEGFVAELASEIVAALGVEVTYLPASGEEGLELVRDGEADLAFPTVGITERLARQNNFSGPYWVAHKRLLVPRDSRVELVEDLDGAAVCQYEEERTGVDLSDVNAAIEITDTTDYRDCIDELRAGGSDATSAADIYLMALADELVDFEIRGEQLSTAGYGAALPEGATDMTTFTNRVLTEAKSEGRWLEYYERWLAPVANIENASAPDLTLEEAATLWPRHLQE
ncbi:MAG: substrate-binding periplasmic protein [Actinomycetota bacterium]